MSTTDDPHTFAYDSTGLMQEQTDPRGELHEYDFDEEGRITRTEDSLGGYSDFVLDYEPAHRTITKTTAEGRTTVYEETRSADGSGVTTFAVTLPTHPGSPPGGARNVRVMHPNGLAQTTMADGRVITTTTAPDPVFGAAALITNEHISNGPFTRSRSVSRSVTLANESDPLSLTAMTETMCENGDAAWFCEHGRVTTRQYTASTRTWETTSPEGRVSSYSLDELGRVASTQTTGTIATDIDYDSEGRLEQIEQGTRLQSFTYDAVTGYLETSTDAEAVMTEYETDDVGRTLSTETDGDVTSFGYDDEGHLTSVTPPDRTAHGLSHTAVDLFEDYTAPQVGSSPTVLTHAYNLDRQLTDIIQPDSTAVELTYHAGGLIHTMVVPGAGTATYTHNARNMLTHVANEAGGFGTNIFGYGAPPNGTGTLVTTLDTTGNHAAGGWTDTSHGNGSLDGQARYWYDNAFKVSVMEAWGTAGQVNGFAPLYVRDTDDLVTSIVPAYPNTGVATLTLIRSDLDGHIESTTMGTSPNTVSTAYDVDVDDMTPGTGDLLGFSASIGSTEVYGVSYQRDELGRITRLDETIESTSTTRKYEYDARGRLIRVRDDNDDIVSEYDYDGNGARTRALTPSGEVELGIDLGCGTLLDTPVDAQDRLCRYGDYEYAYDDNGRLSTKTEISTSDETAYTYDGLGRLRRVVMPDATEIDYVHDALGRRIGKVVDGDLVNGWTYGTDSLRPLAQRDEDGQIEMTFVYETHVNVPDYIVDLETPSKTYRVITDHLGSVRLVVNVATGAVVQQMDYDEFGNVLNDTNPGFQPFGFAGGLYDADTALVRFGVRDYDAVTGRWTAKDPSLFKGGDLNLYRYAAGDPINLGDVNGKDVCVHQSSQGYHHEWISINGNPNQSFGAWPSGNPFWGNQDIQSPDLRSDEIGAPGTSTMCYQSTPEEDRQVEDWIRNNYDFNNPTNNPPYIFGLSDCRHFVDDVVGQLQSIQGSQGGAEGAGGGGGGGSGG